MFTFIITKYGVLLKLRVSDMIFVITFNGDIADSADQLPCLWRFFFWLYTVCQAQFGIYDTYWLAGPRSAIGRTLDS